MRMPAPSPESAHKLGETALLAIAFVLPLAFYLHTYDSIAIKFAVLQWGALALVLFWLWQGLAVGRFAAPASSWPALLPALAYGAWMIGRFALAPHKLGALPDFLTQLTMLAAYLAAFLGFAGARSAARFATLVVLAGWIVALYGFAQVAGIDPFVWKGAWGQGPVGSRLFSTLANPYLCAAFFACAVPLALTLELDPETPQAVRLAALAFVPVAGLATLLTGSPVGAASFGAALLIYAGVVAACLRTPAALKSAGLALLVGLGVGAGTAFIKGPRSQNWPYAAEFRRHTVSAELKMIAEKPLTGFGPGSFFIHYPRFRPEQVIRLEGKHNTMTQHPELPLLGVAVELGLIGAGLWLLLFGVALWTALRGARALRRAGALPESTYAAGFAAAALGGLAAAHVGYASFSPAPGWYAWPLAGLAAGLAPLAARRAAVSVYPLPVSEDIRRALYAPSLLVFAALAVLPGAWLRSDVLLNEGIYYAKSERDMERAAERFGRVLPGSANWPMAAYFKGNALIDAGDYGGALAAYDALQRQAPDYVLVHMMRAKAHAKLGDWELAAAEHRRQSELDPIYLPNLVAWAEAARAAGNLEEAKLAAGKAQALDAEDPAVRLQVAANGLMERKLLAEAKRAKNGRSTARKPK